MREEHGPAVDGADEGHLDERVAGTGALRPERVLPPVRQIFLPHRSILTGSARQCQTPPTHRRAALLPPCGPTPEELQPLGPRESRHVVRDLALGRGTRQPLGALGRDALEDAADRLVGGDPVVDTARTRAGTAWSSPS